MVTSTDANEVQSVLDEAAELRTLPIIVLECQALVGNETTSAQDLANLIQRDPVLAARVLKLANSPYYGLRHNVGNLAQAIVVLGFQAIRNVAATVGAIETFRVDGDDHFDYSGFWAHSVAVAIAADVLGRRLGAGQPDQLYVAGLFHDVGRIIIRQHFPQHALAIEAQVRTGIDARRAEVDVLGLDHAQIAARFLSRWELPEPLVTAIERHHDPVPNRGRIGDFEVLQLADVLASQFGLGHAPSSEGGSDADDHPIASPGLSRRLGYDRERLVSLIDDVTQQWSLATEFFELVGRGPVRF